MAPVEAKGGNFITEWIASCMADNDDTEKRFVEHALRLDAGCKRMKETWSDANQTTNGWKPKQKKGEPCFVAFSSSSSAVQKTNALGSLIAYHDRL